MADFPSIRADDAVICGPYILRRAQRSVSFQGMPLTAAALDALDFAVLALLLEHCGALLGETALMAQLPADSGADSASLWRSVSALNAVLAECSREAGYIAHTPGLGFSLVLPAEAARAKRPPPAGALIGRDDVLALIAAQLPQRRFATIVGAGGMGKTALALALAARLERNYADGVCFVDLAPLADGALLAAALASALGLSVAGPDTLHCLTAYLRDKRMLVVFDSCEHIVADAALVTEAIAGAAAGVHILATSREPLLAAGEWLHRLAPMQMPAPAAVIGAAEALRYPALQLFVARVRARSGGAGFVLSEAQAPLACALCRRLDGIPLAIELAAAWVPLLGIELLAAQIDARLLQAADPFDAAATRHRTLAATLDWSYELLSARERLILRRLSVFRAGFSLEAASAVLAGAGPDAGRDAGLDGAPDAALDAALDADTAVEGLLDLMSKSLVAKSSAANGAEPAAMQFRLLDTTRLYAGEKLAADGERALMLQRHGVYLCGMLARADLDWERMDRLAWLARYAPWIDDIRAVLDWAEGPGGDRQLALVLTVASLSLGHQASLTMEFERRVERIVKLTSQLPAAPDPMATVRLITYLGSCHWRLTTDTSALMVTLEDALAAALQARVASYPAALLTALWGCFFVAGDYPGALEQGNRLAGIARDCGDTIAALISERTRAQSLHFLGRHDAARQFAAHVLENGWRPIPLPYNPSPVGVGVSMRIVLARILWLQGMPEQARRMAADCLRQAEGDTAVALCQALALAVIPIALWCGDDDAAPPLTARLWQQADSHSLDYWKSWSLHYQDVHALRSGLPASAAPSGRQAPDHKQRDHLATFDAAWLDHDRMARIEAGLVGWNAPEILRLQAERELNQGGEDAAAAAEALLQRALALAQQQAAPAWQLRCATSLARLWQGQGRRPEARRLLAPLYAGFREGFETADLRQARQLLADLD